MTNFNSQLHDPDHNLQLFWRALQSLQKYLFKKKNATEIKDNKRALDRTMKRRGLDPGDNENLRGSRVLLFSVV